MEEGPQKGAVDLTFAIPSVCAEVIERGDADVGLVPVAQIARQGLEIVPGVGICCEGSVRSILLVSQTPVAQIRTLAVDSSSRTSVQLARVILRERYGVEPRLFARRPVLDEMLNEMDAALLIGDPALRIDPANAATVCLDLGEEWFRLTGLPMVFAAWAGKPGLYLSKLESMLVGSHEYGAAHLNEIVDREHLRRGITRELAIRYLSENIHFRLGAAERRGLQTFLTLAGLPLEAEFLASYS
jgi:chorismate dehydratase